MEPCVICGDKMYFIVQVQLETGKRTVCQECAYDIFQQVDAILERHRVEGDE